MLLKNNIPTDFPIETTNVGMQDELQQDIKVWYKLSLHTNISIFSFDFFLSRKKIPLSVQQGYPARKWYPYLVVTVVMFRTDLTPMD